MTQRRIVICAALAFAAVISGAASAGAALVQIRDRVTVEGTVVRLGDIANVSDSDEAIADRMRGLLIAPAPANGRELRLDFSAIRSRLEALGINLATTEFAGSSQVVVTKASAGTDPQNVPRENNASKFQQQKAERILAEAVEASLATHHPELGRVAVKVSVSETDIPEVLQVSAGGFDVQGGKEPWGMPQRMMVRFLNRAEVIREIEIECRLSPRPYALVAKYALPIGHVIRDADLMWTQDAVSNAAAGFERAEDVIGRETTRAVRQGTPLEADDIRDIPLVRTSDIVTVYSRAGGITVKRQLKAREDGSRGDTITLVTLDGRERILAQVIGYHEAEVAGAGTAVPASPQTDIGGVRFEQAINTTEQRNGNRYVTPVGGTRVQESGIRSQQLRNAQSGRSAKRVVRN